MDFFEHLLVEEALILEQLAAIRLLKKHYGQPAPEAPANNEEQDEDEQRVWLEETYEKIKTHIQSLTKDVVYFSVKEVKQLFNLSAYRHSFFYEKLKREGVITTVARGSFRVNPKSDYREKTEPYKPVVDRIKEHILSLDENEEHNKKDIWVYLKCGSGAFYAAYKELKDSGVVVDTDSRFSFKFASDVPVPQKEEAEDSAEQPVNESPKAENAPQKIDKYYEVKKHILSLDLNDDEYSSIVEIKNKFNLTTSEYSFVHAELIDNNIIVKQGIGYFKLHEQYRTVLESEKGKEADEEYKCIHEEIYDYVVGLPKWTRHNKDEIHKKFGCCYSTFRKAMNMLCDHNVITEEDGYIVFVNSETEIKDSKNEDDYYKPKNYTAKELRNKKNHVYDMDVNFGNL